MNIDGKTKTIGLIGCPVEHTLSPVIHNSLSRIFAKNMAYLPFHVEEAQVGNAVSGAYGLGILGLNVTVPHKQHVMEYLVDIDDAARTIGAVNTLVRTKGGYKGYNTDMEGLRRAVLSEGISLAEKTVVILGAGGASKAVVYMCMLEGAKKIYLLNRTLSKAEEIAAAMNIHFAGNSGRQSDETAFRSAENRVIPMKLSDYPLIAEDALYVFQATSIGLAPHIDDCVIEDAAFYKKVCMGFDLIYNPGITSFMRRVMEAGGQAFNGLKMLLYQGVIAYSYWTGLPFDVLEGACGIVYEQLYHRIHKQENLVLIGFMGSGKSTVGRALAHRLEYEFLDTDAYIENREGMSVSDIFASKGEDYFRQLETETIQELMERRSHTVFATGGGMPLREENARLLRLLGRTIYLQASAKETYERLRGDLTRPLLQGDNPMAKIVALQKQRIPSYEAAAHVKVDVDDKRVDAIIEEILYKLDFV